MSKYLVFLARGNELGYIGSKGFTEKSSDALRFGGEADAEAAFKALEENDTFTANLIYELIDDHGFASIRRLNERTK
jgi:hypothetical protein